MANPIVTLQDGTNFFDMDAYNAYLNSGRNRSSNGGFHTSNRSYSHSYGNRRGKSAFAEDRERIEELNDALRESQQEIDEANAQGNDTTELLRKHNAILKEQEEYYKRRPGFVAKLNEDLQNIGGHLSRAYGELKSITSEWGKIDHAASQYTKTLGGTAQAMAKLRDATLNNVVKGKIGINYNVSTEELLKMQEDYAKAVGRNIRVSNADQENLAAMHAVMQGGEQELAAAFENFGVSLSDVGKHAGEMFSDASKAGISFEKYSKNVSQNIKIAQNYTFKDGLKGLESMAKKATALKLDMQMAASFADKVNTVEGAIDVASKLQVLGGPFANFADPMGMLNEGLNDIEGLQDRMAKMIGGMGTFNKETGEVQVSAFNKRRIAEAAQAMGVSSDQLMESVNAQARRKEIGNQLAASKAGAGLSDEMKELIKNSGTFKDGKAGVSINGEFKSIDELKNSDYEELVKETQSESEDIKDIAKNLRSLVDMQEGASKQKDAVKAKMTSPIAELEKKVTKGLGQSNFFLGIIAATQVMGNFKGIKESLLNVRDIVGSAFGKGGNIFGKLGNLGNTFSKFGGIFKRGAGRVGKRALIKTLGKSGATKVLGLGGKIGSLFAGGAGTAGAGLTGGLTAVGSALAPFAAPLAAVAAVAAGRAIAKKRRTKELDGRLSALGVERQGKYSPERLKQINNALETGKMSNATKKALLRKGDSAIVEQIEAKEKAIKDEKIAKREKRKEDRLKRREALHGESTEKRINTAYFNVDVAHFGGNLTPSIFKAKPEEGKGEKITPFEKARRINSERGSVEAIPTDFNININGSLKLESNGQSVDILNIVKKDPQLQRELANILRKNILEGLSQSSVPGKKQDLYQQA